MMSRDQKKDLLELIPAYRRGDLSPSKAHEVARTLEEDRGFAEEAEREHMVVTALSELQAVPMPRGLVNKSVRHAVGDVATSRWFSLDTLLIAIGVGLACAAIAQLLASQFPLPSMSGLLLSLAKFAAGNSVALYFGTVSFILILLSISAWVVYRAIRT